MLHGKDDIVCYEKNNREYKYLNMDCGVYKKNERIYQYVGMDKVNDRQTREKTLDINYHEQDDIARMEGDRSEQRRNPNDVLRSILLAIKPPDGRPESACGSLPRMPSKSPSAFSELISSEEYEYVDNQLGEGEEDDGYLLGTNKVTDELLQQIDRLLQFDHGREGKARNEGDRAMSFNQGPLSYTKSQQDRNEWSFLDDSGLSSDWSPLSTLDSGESSATSTKSCRGENLVPISPTPDVTTVTHANRVEQAAADRSQLLESPSSNTEYSQSELSAVRKFITLIRKYFDEVEGKALRNMNPLHELQMIPDIKSMMESQNREVKNQREMIQGFICQLGDLLTEILNLKEEQTAVRTKQTKALALLKKQLDHHKASVSQTYQDIRQQVNILYDKINTYPNNVEPVTGLISNSKPKSVSSHPPKSSRKSKSNISRISPSSSSRSNSYGHIIWKVSEVMKKITMIKSGLLDAALISDSFQTGEYAYNMNAWIYLNGRGKMTGTCLSVYVCILVGEYDAILTWPVRPTYKFTLLDQRGDVVKRQDHFRYRRVMDIADCGESVISQYGGVPRPKDGSKALIVGLDEFITHEELLKDRYLVDDVLYLKVEAEVN